MAILQTLLLPLVLAASAVVGDGWLGIRLADADRPTIAEVFPRSPAATAGLKAGDVIVSINGKATRTVESLFELFQGLNAGDWAKLRILRKRKNLDFKVRLAVRPVEGRPPVRIEERPAKKPAKRPVKRPVKKPVKKPAKRPVKKPARVGKRDGRPAFIGIEIEETDRAVVVTSLVKGAPAIRAGLRRGDQVRSFNGKAIRNLDQLDEIMRGLHARDSIRIGLRRNGRNQEIVLTAAAKPGAEVRLPAKRLPGKRAPGKRAPGKRAPVARVVKRRTPAKKTVVRTAPTKVAAKSVGLAGFSSSLDSALGKARRSGRPLLVIFGASWCVNCASLKKSLAHSSLRSTLARYERAWIDTDEQSALADKYGVESIPHAMIMSANGKVQKTIIGYQPPQILAKYLRAGVSTGAKDAAAKRRPTPRTATSKKLLPGKIQPKKAQPKKAQPKKAQPKKAQPKKVQLRRVQPKKGQPKKGQPKKGQPKRVQLRRVQPKQAQPKQAQPKRVKRNRGKTGKVNRRGTPVRGTAATELARLRAEVQRLRVEQRKQGKLLERILRELQKKQ